MDKVIPFRPLRFTYNIDVNPENSYRIHAGMHIHKDFTIYNMFCAIASWEDMDTAKADCKKLESDIRSGKTILQDGDFRRIV